MTPEEKRQLDELKKNFLDLQNQSAVQKKILDSILFSLKTIFPQQAGFYSGASNTFSIRLPNLPADPVGPSIGSALIVSGGKLKVWSSGAWVIVGTQT